LGARAPENVSTMPTRVQQLGLLILLTVIVVYVWLRTAP